MIDRRIDNASRFWARALLLAFANLACLPLYARGAPDREVLEAQSARAAAMARASEATVAVFDSKGSGGGSAVLITSDGFALTNFHVVAGSGPGMKCGLSDGKLYDAVVVGIDPVGDLALIQVLGRGDFPTAEIGDSDDVRVGDWAFAAGNPFLLADDFRPSISYGIVSGVHRYQYPAGTLLEYTDCIQTDAAINPGNSGGPLWNAEGKLIGINGRGSFEKRGRVNVGVGYAISINQAMRFFSHLQSGRIVDHASLGATATTEEDGQVVVDDILETSDAFRRGLQYGDSILRFAGREINSANELKNILGVFPSKWRTTLAFRRDGKAFERKVRLEPLHDETALAEMVQKEQQTPSEPKPQPKPGDDEKQPPAPDEGPQLPIPLPDALKRRKTPKLPEAVAKRYEARRGYANYWYNRQAQERLWSGYVKSSKAKGLGYDWDIAGHTEAGEPFTLKTAADRAQLVMPSGESGALFTGDVSDQLSPPRSGGFLLALHAWQRLIEKGLDQFGEVYYLGRLPHGPDDKVEECLVGLYEGMEIHFFFAPPGDLTGIELFSADDADPCELSLSQFDEIEGRRLPRRFLVLHGDETFGELVVDQWVLGPANSQGDGVK